MDLKPIIIRDYLESLTENEELDSIFPILLESKGFIILSKPKEFKGFPQYGKDIVAVGKDFEDGILRRFYFEIKGGADRHITTQTYNKNDGIRESIIEAKDKNFSSTYDNFENLPLKIILVHNGEVKANVKDTFEDFIKKEFSKSDDLKFERWGISELTKLFSEHLFGAFLLTDQTTTKLFNRALVNLNVSDGISKDYIDLLNLLLNKEEWKSYNKEIPRKWKLLFESLKLISFIIYTESKDYNNLDIAKRYITHLVIRFWHWILKNKLEKDKNVTKYFHQVFTFYFHEVLGNYYGRTMPIAEIRDGLHSEKAGRYEQIGYTVRTFEYLYYFCFALNIDKHNPKFDSKISIEWLLKFIHANNVSSRPLIDIHSITIVDIMNLLIEFGETESAKKYLQNVLGFIKLRKENYDVLPDANNSIENVIKFTVNGKKPVYYSDATSPLLAVLMEYTAILDMEDTYNQAKEFILKNKIDLGVFVPHHGINSTSKDLINDLDNDLEEQLFSKSVHDGYQSDLSLTKLNYEDLNIDNDLNFEDFKKKINDRKNEFEYNYRTDNEGYPFLRSLAHYYFMTPYFPDKWRNIN